MTMNVDMCEYSLILNEPFTDYLSVCSVNSELFLVSWLTPRSCIVGVFHGAR